MINIFYFKLQEKLKRIPSLKKELYEIFKADAGAPKNYDVFMAIWARREATVDHKGRRD